MKKTAFLVFLSIVLAVSCGMAVTDADDLGLDYKFISVDGLGDGVSVALKDAEVWCNCIPSNFAKHINEKSTWIDYWEYTDKEINNGKTVMTSFAVYSPLFNIDEKDNRVYVFISEDQHYQEWVARFANQIEKNGVDVDFISMVWLDKNRKEHKDIYGGSGWLYYDLPEGFDFKK